MEDPSLSPGVNRPAPNPPPTTAVDAGGSANHLSGPVSPAPPALSASPGPAPNQTAIYNPDTTLWINVALSAATLAVACLGIVVALAAIVGYQSARRMVKNMAKKHATIAAREHLRSPEFKIEIQGVANDLISDHIKSRIMISLSEATNEPRTEMRE